MKKFLIYLKFLRSYFFKDTCKSKFRRHFLLSKSKTNSFQPVFLCDKGCVSAKAFERKDRKRERVSVSVLERESVCVCECVSCWNGCITDVDNVSVNVIR